MTRGPKLLVAGVLGLIGGAGVLLLLSVLFVSPRSVTEKIREDYRLVADQNNGRSLTFAAATSPVATANQIADDWTPAQRINDPGGTFLRYRDVIVAVTSDGGQGAHVHVDDENGGYQRWYGYVGGSWGTFSGRGEAFRGGGPGGGK